MTRWEKSILGGQEQSWPGLWRLGKLRLMGRGRQGGHAQGHTVNQCCADSRLGVPRKALELAFNAPFIQKTFFGAYGSRLCWALELLLGARDWPDLVRVK